MRLIQVTLATLAFMFSVLSFDTSAKADILLPGGWMHNGSYMNSQIDGNNIVISYGVPSNAMRGLVSDGTTLFSGKIRGNTISGYTTVFSARCGSYSQFVEGYIIESGGDYTIKMSGPAPSPDRNCNVTWVWNGNSRLVFESWHHD